MAKEMIAMLLAGGQGSRLYALTQKLAKPAVPFGGKYRIIDFPLSIASLPQAVLGGCTIMMFGTILTSGVQMIAKCGFSQRNIVIVSLSLAVGIGFTTASEIGIWDIFPELVQSVFSANVVAVVFVVSVFLSLVLPKDMDIKTLEG